MTLRLYTLRVKDENGQKTFYIYGLGLIGQEINDKYTSYHFDFRGSTVALTDSSGQITDSFQYSPYGLLLSGDSSKTPFLFNGMYGVMTDSNGLYYMRARFYSPEIKRFINQDILLGGIGEVQTLNRYVYVNGDPVKYNDPFGLAKKKDPNSGSCKSLARRIKNLEQELEKRYKEYADDPFGLPERIGPGEALYETKRGHRTKINETDSRLNKNLKKYYDECGEPPPPSGIPVDEDNNQSYPLECSIENDGCDTVVKVVFIGGTAYIVYRCIRMFPSLFPPLWPTIPANVITP